MNEVPETPKEQEYVPDPVKEKQAKAVHFTVSIIRLLGLALLMLGIAIAMDRLPPTPPFAGYVLIALGLLQVLFIPIWIIRQYVKARVAEEEIAKRDGSKNDG